MLLLQHFTKILQILMKDIEVKSNIMHVHSKAHSLVAYHFEKIET